ncbi:MAG: hypothetical protein Q8O44_03125, partial [Syntrophales bacterium]|nr:hypothetical protein [Syntrophales bacterium]
IIKMPEVRDTFLDAVVSYVNQFLIYNLSSVRLGIYGYVEVPTRSKWLLKVLKLIIITLIFWPLSKIRFVRKGLQWLDFNYLQKSTVLEYKKIVKEYSPDVIFSANIMEDTEAALLKAARMCNVPTISMPKSWDNPSKRYFRARADMVAAWSPFMRDQMMKLQDYKKDQIHSDRNDHSQ